MVRRFFVDSWDLFVSGNADTSVEVESVLHQVFADEEIDCSDS